MAFTHTRSPSLPNLDLARVTGKHTGTIQLSEEEQQLQWVLNGFHVDQEAAKAPHKAQQSTQGGNKVSAGGYQQRFIKNHVSHEEKLLNVRPISPPSSVIQRMHEVTDDAERRAEEAERRAEEAEWRAEEAERRAEEAEWRALKAEEHLQDAFQRLANLELERNGLQVDQAQQVKADAALKEMERRMDGLTEQLCNERHEHACVLEKMVQMEGKHSIQLEQWRRALEALEAKEFDAQASIHDPMKWLEGPEFQQLDEEELTQLQTKLEIAQSHVRQRICKVRLEKRLCKICFSADANIVLNACGHLVLCDNCVERVDNCPLCRCPVSVTSKATTRVFF